MSVKDSCRHLRKDLGMLLTTLSIIWAGPVLPGGLYTEPHHPYSAISGSSCISTKPAYSTSAVT
jgi:hypothetical protein